MRITLLEDCDLGLSMGALLPPQDDEVLLEECPDCGQNTLSFHIKAHGQCSYCIEQNRVRGKGDKLYCYYV